MTYLKNFSFVETALKQKKVLNNKKKFLTFAIFAKNDKQATFQFPVFLPRANGLKIYDRNLWS